jgi:hypothetical protein
VTRKAAHGPYGEISSPAWESRYQYTDEPCRLELSHDLSRRGLNDPQILMLELAHGMLIDTETYSECQYRYWHVAQVPVDGRLGDDDRTSALLILASSVDPNLASSCDRVVLSSNDPQPHDQAQRTRSGGGRIGVV